MTADVAALERVLSRTALCMRVQRGLDWAAWAVTISSLCATGLSLTTALPWSVWSSIAAGTGLAFVLGAVMPVRRGLVADQIDRVAQLDGRMRAAVDFLHATVEPRKPFVSAALRDAAAHAAGTSAYAIAPLRRPRLSLPALLGLAACLLATTLPEPVPHVVERAPASQHAEAPLLDHDELQGLRDELRDASSARLPAHVRSELEEYETLLRQIERAELPASALIASALALEAKLELVDPQAASDSSLSNDAARAQADDDAALQQLSRELSRATPTLARALVEDLQRAAQELRTLAAQVSADALAASDKKQLADALDKARERERHRAAELAREQELTSLLKRSEPEAESAREPSLLKRRQEQKRELETLRRARERPLQRELSKLSRELARAGAALAEHAPEPAADALRQSSDALEQLQREQSGRSKERELQHAVEQLREMLQRRQQQQQQQARGESGDEPRSERARSDRQQADGEREQSEPEQGEQQASESQAQRRQRFSELARGQFSDAGTRAFRAEPAASDDRAEAGRGGAETQTAGVQLQPVGVPELVESVEITSSGAGTGHDSARAAATPRSHGAYEDQSLRGSQGAGPTRSQVIRSAAGSGFARADYRKVYGDYREHAEALLEHDRVPRGFRFHVRRYFELVRPREGQDTP